MKTSKIAIIIFFISLVASNLVDAQALDGCQVGASGVAGIVAQVSPWYCTYVNPQIASVWVKWLPLLLLAITIAFSIATLLFLLGVVLKNDRLRTFGIGEIYEAIATTVIVGLFLFIAAILFGVLPAFGGAINPYNSELSYMASTINSTATTAYGLFDVAARAAFLGSIGLQTDIGPISAPPVADWFAFTITYLFFWPAWSIVVFMVEALFSFYTQFYLVLFIMYAAIPAFLIPGILFRTFIPTRSLGGMMMAIAIAFYFVMPTLFAIAYADTANNIASQLTGINTALANYGQNAEFVQAASSPGAPLVSAVQGLTSSLSSFWLAILFFPAIIIAVTYSAITQISELLGGYSKTSSKLRSLV